MPIITNPYGELRAISTNVGGQIKELQSVYTNVGGQLKEIYTLLPKPIVGTWSLSSGMSSFGNVTPSNGNCIAKNLKFPENRNVKVKMTLTITDNCTYKDLGNNLIQYHEAKIYMGKFLNGTFNSEMSCGTYYSTDTRKTYTSENTFLGSYLNEYSIHVGRWAGYKDKDANNTYMTFYSNGLLSFDYSIEFELV